ncbi:hypothetical protein ROZALSC1DRAFT_28482 [Rozella allomycis CSF55]|uniref:Rab3-GAP regulatory subunit N-terminal domain-containing protein n=1 Tax=Rozella allomycis (strain CSF55) TaxID=988480 RepID=A0A4P9YKJ2_ROZAC|nr:hypothetical protein ROZALSC1DRAFT_28482 [Rozella allomycis CSF55]
MELLLPIPSDILQKEVDDWNVSDTAWNDISEEDDDADILPENILVDYNGLSLVIAQDSCLNLITPNIPPIKRFLSFIISCLKLSNELCFFGSEFGDFGIISNNGELKCLKRIHNEKVLEIELFDNSVGLIFEDQTLIIIDLNDILQGGDPQFKRWSLKGMNVMKLLKNSTKFPFDFFEYKPQYSKLLVLGCGNNKPLISIYGISEDSIYSTAVEAATKIASRLTSAVFGIAKSFVSESNNSNVVTPPQPLPLLESLSFDPSQEGNKIVNGPQNSGLALVFDSFGRILLLDIYQFVVLRVLKGYRSANAGFINHKDKLYIVLDHKKQVV